MECKSKCSTTFSNGRPITVCNQDQVTICFHGFQHSRTCWSSYRGNNSNENKYMFIVVPLFRAIHRICKFYVLMLYSNSIQTRNKWKYVFSFSICSNPFVKSCCHYHFHHFSSKSILGIGFGVVTVWTQLLFATVRFESRLRSINCVIY